MSFGTDPEFIIRRRDNNRVVPAHVFNIPMQQDKIRIDGYSSISYFRDGVAVEINTAPHFCRGNMGNDVKRALHAVQARIGPDFYLDTSPTVELVLEEDLMNAPDDVLRFGCMPSLNAYTGEENVVPLDGTLHPFRYLAGHLHWGWEGYSDSEKMLATSAEARALYIRMLDLYMGIPLVLLLGSAGEFARRQFYGRAGEYRDTPHPDRPHMSLKVEYRTPSSQIYNSMALVGLASGIMRAVARSFIYFRNTWDANMEPYIQHAINTGEGAIDIASRLDLPDFYNPDVLIKLHNNRAVFSTFNFMNEVECHTGWAEKVKQVYGTNNIARIMG